MSKNDLEAKFRSFCELCKDGTEITLPASYHFLSVPNRIKVRNKYVELQKGKCYHCKKPLDGPPADKVSKKQVVRSLFPPNFFNYPVHLHHDHKTGMTIGAVHNYCNAVLFQYHNE